jgi:DNA-binding SARP family transcriptional activator
MTHLALALLGPMQVIVQGQLISSFPYQKVRALLAFLAIESEQPHHRDRIADLLWTDQPESKARANLRKALSVLRQSLEGETDQIPLFLTTRHTIQFNPEVNHTLDIDILTQLLDPDQDQTGSVHKLSPKSISDLEQAVALYRGPLLAQLQLPEQGAFEAWVRFHRERFHDAVINAYSELVAHYEAQRHYEKAQHYAQRQLQLEPWNEAAHRALMRIWAQSGRRAAALQQYMRCCQILEQEFAAQPEPVTMATWDAIRSGRHLHAPAHNHSH